MDMALFYYMEMVYVYKVITCDPVRNDKKETFSEGRHFIIILPTTRYLATSTVSVSSLHHIQQTHPLSVISPWRPLFKFDIPSPPAPLRPHLPSIFLSF
ncbi:hypothetical protein HW555_008203 [Spodoptera exigua]|uniref:Uncharacterized protein n=1 Tax=Spodoptera exigua TaxID=7107 RepID=A0A835GCY0_SPOEX|nr:hypothetical protein HW555_008203 [Spodoptera exigua]